MSDPYLYLAGIPEGWDELLDWQADLYLKRAALRAQRRRNGGVVLATHPSPEESAPTCESPPASRSGPASADNSQISCP